MNPKRHPASTEYSSQRISEIRSPRVGFVSMMTGSRSHYVMTPSYGSERIAAVMRDFDCL